MHIVIATGLYPPEIGGPATFAVFFEQGLKARDISFVTVPFARVRHLPNVVRHGAYLWNMVRAIRSDSIVLALDPVSVGLPALLAARLRRRPFYLRVGGDYAWEQAVQRWGFKGLPEEFSHKHVPSAGKILVWVQSFVARRARRVLVQSTYVASIVERWGIPADRITVIPNGVSLPRLPTREDARREFGFGNEPVIVSAGRFVPWKGLRAVIGAFRSIQEAHPSARLVLAGDGPERDMLIAEHGEGLNIRFTGIVPKEKLFSLLRAADVFVLNTRYEGFSHQLLEAMAAGIPVVTTDIPANTELAQNGETALVVEWNDVPAIRDAIARLLRDRELANRIAQRGQGHVARFTPERTFAETLKVLGIDL